MSSLDVHLCISRPISRRNEKTMAHRCSHVDVEIINVRVFTVFQVLQQECVDMESLDDVDSTGKVLLDRLTMPVIFPDGYVNTQTHTHTHTCKCVFLLFGAAQLVSAQ